MSMSNPPSSLLLRPDVNVSLRPSCGVNVEGAGLSLINLCAKLAPFHSVNPAPPVIFSVFYADWQSFASRVSNHPQNVSTALGQMYFLSPDRVTPSFSGQGPF